MLAFLGEITAERFAVDAFSSFSVRTIASLSSFIEVAGTTTVTRQPAVYPPSSVVTVIVVEPLFNGVIVPSAETVATDLSELFHVIFLSDASEGLIVAVNFVLGVFPSATVIFPGSDTPVTFCKTVNANFFRYAVPLAVIPAVTVPLPADSPVSCPFAKLASLLFDIAHEN